MVSTPPVTTSAWTSSAAPRPVTLDVSVCHRPTSWNAACVVAIGEVEKRRRANALQVDAGRGVIDGDAAGRSVRERQRLEQHAFDDAEDRRVGADADRERDDRDGREHRQLQQPAQDLLQHAFPYIRATRIPGSVTLRVS